MRDRTSLCYLEEQAQIDELKLYRLLVRPVLCLRQRRRQLHDSRIFDQLTGLMVTVDEKRIYEPDPEDEISTAIGHELTPMTASYSRSFAVTKL